MDLKQKKEKKKIAENVKKYSLFDVRAQSCVAAYLRADMIVKTDKYDKATIKGTARVLY